MTELSNFWSSVRNWVCRKGGVTQIFVHHHLPVHAVWSCLNVHGHKEKEGVYLSLSLLLSDIHKYC